MNAVLKKETQLFSWFRTDFLSTNFQLCVDHIEIIFFGIFVQRLFLQLSNDISFLLVITERSAKISIDSKNLKKNQRTQLVPCNLFSSRANPNVDVSMAEQNQILQHPKTEIDRQNVYLCTFSMLNLSNFRCFLP